MKRGWSIKNTTRIAWIVSRYPCQRLPKWIRTASSYLSLESVIVWLRLSGPFLSLLKPIRKGKSKGFLLMTVECEISNWLRFSGESHRRVTISRPSYMQIMKWGKKVRKSSGSSFHISESCNSITSLVARYHLGGFWTPASLAASSWWSSSSPTSIWMTTVLLIN